MSGGYSNRIAAFGTVSAWVVWQDCTYNVLHCSEQFSEGRNSKFQRLGICYPMSYSLLQCSKASRLFTCFTMYFSVVNSVSQYIVLQKIFLPSGNKKLRPAVTPASYHNDMLRKAALSGLYIP